MEKARKYNVWESMYGWEDPREVHPPMGCLVGVVQEDLEVHLAKIALSPDNSILEWVLENGAAVPFDHILAWAWVETIDEMFPKEVS